MSTWDEFLESVRTALIELSDNHCPDPYFRGHGDSKWKLEPSLARQAHNPRFHANKERRLFWDFRMLGSHLLPRSLSDWDILFYMQHHGMPTRLLDWTTSFSTALHFALKSPTDEIAVWLLNPYALNEAVMGKRVVSNLNVSFKMDYRKFMNMPVKPVGAMAIAGDSSVGRIHAQGAAFTIHGSLDKPLEELYPATLKKFTLPETAFTDARSFLDLAGVTEFSIFPDLDGLSRYLVKRELGRG